MKTLNINRTNGHSDKSLMAPFSKMEAIACGVQVRFEESTGYSKKVIDETINIARSLGVSNVQIERWAIDRRSRLEHDIEKFREIKSLLNRT